MEIKRLLLTGCNAAQSGLIEVTSPVMLTYANRHGIDFKCVRQYPDDTHPMWQKIAWLHQELKIYRQVIWLDADMLVTNMRLTPWEKMTGGLHLSRDWGPDATSDNQFTTACIVANRDAARLLSAMINSRDEWHEAEFHEQAQLRSMFALHRSRFTIHPRRVLNAVPIEVHESAPDTWQPGDWLCHATHLPINERIALLRSKLE